MLFKKSIFSLSICALLVGCSGTPQDDTSVGKIPSWILNPDVEDGIAVAECVIFSGNMSIDKQQAIANARTALAQRIETKITAMDKVYRDKVEVSTGVESGSTFSSVSKQITEQTLVGTTALKTDFVEIAENDNLCVLLGIGQKDTQALFDQLVSKSERVMSADQKEVLYTEFKAQRAQEELQAELEEFKNR